MEEFPDEYDDFEEMYADEMELLKEMEIDGQPSQPSSNVQLEKASQLSSDASAGKDNPLIKTPNSDHEKENQREETLREALSRANELLDKTDSLEGRVKRSLPFDDLDANDTLEARETRPKKKKALVPMVDQHGYCSKEKGKLDTDLELIERIVAYRYKSTEEVSLGSISKNNLSRNAESSRRKHKPVIHKHIPPSGFQSVTTCSGKRFYLDFLEEEEFQNKIDAIGNEKEHLNLLTHSFASIKRIAEEELEKLVIRRSTEEFSARTQPAPTTKETDPACDLWVERYKPRNYLDLLSDEATNRTVLNWVKLWDKLVFGVERKIKQKKTDQNNQNNDLFKKDFKRKFFNKAAPEVIKELDEQGKPQQKVVLLCGAPGLGKTTLAHIIARHAGYNIIEMNASDDRSTEVFRTNMENATSMQAVFGNNRLPNCLIIDEIDGAPSASINLLVNMLNEKTGKDDMKKSKRRDSFTLKRPVICICNDLFTPALRPLRLISLVIQFPPTYTFRLTQRLYDICSKQKLRADRTVLRALCDKTENDIRSCLSALQFIKGTSGVVRLCDLEGVAVGQKDYQRSLFSVWRDLFTVPRPKRKLVLNPHERKFDVGTASTREEIAQSDKLSRCDRFNGTLRTVQSCGEYDKLLLGWFENYPQVKFKDVNFSTVVAGLEWCAFNDIIQKEIHHSQNWILFSYLSFAFVALHFLFAVHQSPKLQFPTRFNEYLNRVGKCRSIISTLTSDMAPYTLFFANSTNLIFDVLPYLTQIIQPNLRSVNVKLFSQREKVVLNELVRTMVAFNLTYQQERSPEGKYSFNLEPNVEELVHFVDIPKTKSLPYSSRQLIAREVELEKVRRAEKYFDTEDSKAPKTDSLVPSKPPSKISAPPLPPDADAKKIFVKPDQVARDYFGRVVTQTPEEKGKVPDASRQDIWFKFKEGYSNAVRRTVKIKEFIC